MGTIVDKLRRERMRLSQMQDIAGVRIVADVDRVDQDVMVERIRVLFADAKVVDRRSAPSHGYRAVHVIVSLQGRLVEVQVRTELQHLWAQAVERIADLVGRGIRYGELPQFTDEGVKSVKRRIKAAMKLSDTIDLLEKHDVSTRSEAGPEELAAAARERAALLSDLWALLPGSDVGESSS